MAAEFLLLLYVRYNQDLVSKGTTIPHDNYGEQHPSSNFLYTLTCHYVNRGNINCILCILRFVITTSQLRRTGVQYSCTSVFPVSAKGFVRCTGICLGTRLRETHCASRFTRRSAIRLHTSLHTNQLVFKETPWGGRRIVKTKSKYFSFLFFFCGRVSFKHCLISIEGAPGTELRIQLFVAITLRAEQKVTSIYVEQI